MCDTRSMSFAQTLRSWVRKYIPALAAGHTFPQQYKESNIAGRLNRFIINRTQDIFGAETLLRGNTGAQFESVNIIFIAMVLNNHPTELFLSIER